MKKNLLFIISLLISSISTFASSNTTTNRQANLKVFDQLKKVGRVTQHESSAQGGKSGEGNGGTGGRSFTIGQ